MCFNWSVWAEAGQSDVPEHLVHRFGPILAPRILCAAAARRITAAHYRRPENVDPRNVIRLWDRCAFDRRNDLVPFPVTPSGCNRPKYGSRGAPRSSLGQGAQSGCTQLWGLRGVRRRTAQR